MSITCSDVAFDQLIAPRKTKDSQDTPSRLTRRTGSVLSTYLPGVSESRPAVNRLGTLSHLVPRAPLGTTR